MRNNLSKAIVGLLLLTLCICQATFGQIKQQTFDQVKLLIAEKNSRTPAEQKISSQLLQATREHAGRLMATGVNLLPANVDNDAAGNLMVDITANVSDALLARLTALGARVIFSSARFHSIRARVNLSVVNTIAGYSDVKFIAPAAKAHLVGSPGTPLSNSLLQANKGNGAALLAGPKRPSFAKRSAKVKQQLQNYLMMLGAGSATSQGDRTMGADSVRAKYGYQGQGIRIGVMSDSYNATGGAAADIASGDLPGPGNPFGDTIPVTVVQEDPYSERR